MILGTLVVEAGLCLHRDDWSKRECFHKKGTFIKREFSFYNGYLLKNKYGYVKRVDDTMVKLDISVGQEPDSRGRKR
jgi:hypothetical protein